MNLACFSRLLIVSCFVLLNSGAGAADGFTVDKASGGGVVVRVNGMIFAEYVVDQANKPYLAPVFGPTEKQMTRSFPMKNVTGEQQDHPQHRGLGFCHENIGGLDTWEDQVTFPSKKSSRSGLGFVKHRAYAEMRADATHAVIISLCDVLNGRGTKIFEQENRMTFRAGADSRMIDFDVRIIASEGVLQIADVKEAGLCIRVPSSIAVESRLGGTIINSEGLTNEAAWGKRAKWCDYHGSVGGEKVGVAILNHPGSFRFPTLWHVRTYGLFAANPFGMKSMDKSASDGTVDLQKGQDLRLSHRIIFHLGDEKSARIAEAFETYAKNLLPAVPASAQLPAALATSELSVDPNQSLLEMFSQLAPNASAWVLAPLNESVPPNVRQNLTYLREDLLDEYKQKPKASQDSYRAAHQLCSTMIAALDERDQTLVRAGFRAVQADANASTSGNQALNARRNYMMSWPQYAREESQRAELRSAVANQSQVMKEQPKVEWSNRTASLRKTLDDLYAQFREALRQSPSAK